MSHSINIKNIYSFQNFLSVFKSLFKNKVRIPDIVLWSLMIILFSRTILWIGKSFSYSSNRLSLIILLGISGLLIHKIYNKTIKNPLPGNQVKNKTIRIRFNWLPLISLICSVTCYILLEYFIKINIFSSLFFALSMYSLLGLYLPFEVWKKGLIPVILIIQTLPFGNNFDTYLGFPMRIFSTEIAEQALSALGIANISQETIIIIENSAAQVDLSCSGLKGLWSGLLFFFAATWMEQKRLNLRWFVSLILFFTALTAFNILRIVILVITETALLMPKVAAAIHIPLGLTGFIFSCIFAWFMLKSGSDKSNKELSPQKSSSEDKSGEPGRMKLYFFLIPFLLVALWLHQQRNTLQFSSHTEKTFKLQLPSSFSLKPVPLTKLESAFLHKSRGDKAVKKKFKWNNLTGTMLIALNHNWRNHHSPEDCLKGEGLTTKRSATVLMNSTFPVKTLTFEHRNLAASYWFQSPSSTTDDFSSRVWAQVMGKEKTWILVSILFDKQIDWETKKMKAFHLTLFGEVRRILKENSNN